MRRAPAPLALGDVTVIDADGPVRPHQTIDFDGPTISTITPSTGPESGALPVASKYVIAGLTDAHVHFHRRDDLANRAIALLLLSYGVTRVVCMHGGAAVRRLKADIDSGRAIGPRIMSTGPIQNDPGLTYANGRRRARDQARLGYGAVKVYNDLSVDGFRGLCDGARTSGIPVIGHVVRALDTMGTLASQQSTVVHAEEFVYTYFNYHLDEADDREDAKLDVSRLPELAERVSESGTEVIGTLQNFWAITNQANDAQAWFARSETELLPTVITRGWRPVTNVYAKRFNAPFHRRRLLAAAQFQQQLIGAFHTAGVRVLAGTDALVTGSVHGPSLHSELAYLRDSGLSPRAVLAAATSSSAALLREPLAGRVTVGADTDLVVLDDDPLSDIGNAARIAGVVVRGRWYSRDELRTLHAQALGLANGSLQRAGCDSDPKAPHAETLPRHNSGDRGRQ